MKREVWLRFALIKIISSALDGHMKFWLETLPKMTNTSTSLAPWFRGILAVQNKRFILVSCFRSLQRQDKVNF